MHEAEGPTRTSMVVHAVGEARARALEAIAAADVLALDTEFHAERGYTPELCLLQVHVEGQGVWLFDPIRDPDFDGIAEALCEKPWLVHAGRQDVHILARRWGRRPPRVIDVQIAAGLITPHYPLGYAALLERWLGRTVDKGMALSDWTRRPLRKEQVAYAAADVSFLPAVWSVLSEQLRAAQRHKAFEDCCAEALDAWSAPPTVAQRWSQLEARDRLPSEAQAVLWALFEWREQEGMRLDRSPTKVLSDGLAIRLARWKPASLKHLGLDRRMPRALLRRHGEALMAVFRAVAEGRVEHPDDLRPLTAEEAWRRDWLDLVAKGLSGVLDCSPGLLLPQQVRRAWIRKPPSSKDEVFKSLCAWRREMAGALLWRLWSGEAHLTPKVQTPFTVS